MDASLSSRQRIKIRNRYVLLGDLAFIIVSMQLERLAHQGEVETIIRVLDEVIPSAAVRATPPPDLTSIV